MEIKHSPPDEEAIKARFPGNEGVVANKIIALVAIGLTQPQIARLNDLIDDEEPGLIAIDAFIKDVEASQGKAQPEADKKLDSSGTGNGTSPPSSDSESDAFDLDVSDGAVLTVLDGEGKEVRAHNLHSEENRPIVRETDGGKMLVDADGNRVGVAFDSLERRYYPRKAEREPTPTLPTAKFDWQGHAKSAGKLASILLVGIFALAIIANAVLTVIYRLGHDHWPQHLTWSDGQVGNEPTADKPASPPQPKAKVEEVKLPNGRLVGVKMPHDEVWIKIPLPKLSNGRELKEADINQVQLAGVTRVTGDGKPLLITKCEVAALSNNKYDLLLSGETRIDDLKKKVKVRYQ